MNKSFNLIIKFFIVPILLMILFFQIVYFILELYLPKTSVYFIPNKTYQVEFSRYDFLNTFRTINKSSQHKKHKPKKRIYNLLQNIVLKAIYASSNARGWILISDKSNKTSILQVGDKYKNYELYAVYKDYAIFIKDNKEYKLTIHKQLNTQTQKVYEKYAKSVSNSKVEVLDDNFRQIDKNEVISYSKNFKKIWQNISITENMKNGKIDGFKIQRIKKNSIFAKLGLQKNDIIKRVNNIDLKSYADAFKIYNKINKIDFIQITILRGNQIMELEYDIK